MAEISNGPRGRRRSARGLIAGALCALAAARADLGQDVKARIAKARESLESGRTDRAVREASRALEEAPQDPDVHRLLCKIRRVQGRYEEAAAACARAAELAPSRAEYHLDLGDLLAQREDRLDEALRAYHRAAEADPSNPRPHVAVGGLYERRGRLKEAEAEYREALALNPNHVQANAGLGAVLFTSGRLSEARGYLGRAIELRPRDLRSHIFLGLALNHEGQLDLALQELRTAAGIDPHAANQAAGVAAQAPRFERLREIYDARLAEQPEDSTVHYNFAVVAYYLRDYETSWRHLQKAQQLGYPADQGLKEVVYSRWRGQRR
jgi:tetratricopeptide (TPR) repeat protein